MTALRLLFEAHQCDGARAGQLLNFVEGFREPGLATDLRVQGAAVGVVEALMRWHASETVTEVAVLEVHFLKGSPQAVAVEPRLESRHGLGAHIDDDVDVVVGEDLDEVVEGALAVTDGPDGRRLIGWHLVCEPTSQQARGRGQQARRVVPLDHAADRPGTVAT